MISNGAKMTQVTPDRGGRQMRVALDVRIGGQYRWVYAADPRTLVYQCEPT